MTDTETNLSRAAILLAHWEDHLSTPESDRCDLTLEGGDLLEAVGALVAGRWGYLSAITGLDHGAQEGVLEVLYHFCLGAAVVTLRVPVNRSGGVLPSLCMLIPAVTVFEREISEMLGVTFDGAPDTSRLFLAEDWPQGVFPLLKEPLISEADAQKNE